MDIDSHFGDTEERGPIEDIEEIRLKEEEPARVLKVRVNLETIIKEALFDFLRKKQDVFAWSH